jgi:transcriptional regulator with XRE-family HTH domain
MTTVPELLKRLRAEAELSQAELAERVGTDQPQVSKWERGKLRLGKEWAEKLAPHLGTDAMRLLFPDGSVSIGFDERLLKLSKVNWLSAAEFDRLVEAIDSVIRIAEDRNPSKDPEPDPDPPGVKFNTII